MSTKKFGINLILISSVQFLDVAAKLNDWKYLKGSSFIYFPRKFRGLDRYFTRFGGHLEVDIFQVFCKTNNN